MLRKPEQRLVGKVHGTPIWNIVEHDRPGCVIGKCREVSKKPALRRPEIIGRRYQITVNRPGRGLVEHLLEFLRARAGKAEADRQDAGQFGKLGANGRDKMLKLVGRQQQSFARSRRQNEAVDWAAGVVSHQPPQRQLVERSIAKRCDKRQPQSLQPVSKVVHLFHLLLRLPEMDGTTKNPASHGGVSSRLRSQISIARADLKSPDGDLFSSSALRTNS